MGDKITGYGNEFHKERAMISLDTGDDPTGFRGLRSLDKGGGSHWIKGDVPTGFRG